MLNMCKQVIHETVQNCARPFIPTTSGLNVLGYKRLSIKHRKTNVTLHINKVVTLDYALSTRVHERDARSI